MSTDDGKAIAEIRERMVRVETKIDDIITDMKTAQEARDTARDALQSSKSAHNRIDDISDNQKWIWRTIVGAIIAGAIALLFQNGGA